MQTGQWNKPITYRARNLGQDRTIHTTAEAALVLMNQWPTDKGKSLTKARAVCVQVLEGRRKPAAARKAFLKAARKANVPIR